MTEVAEGRDDPYMWSNEAKFGRSLHWDRYRLHSGNYDMRVRGAGIRS